MEKKRKNILIISIISLIILVIILYFIINNIQINKILSAKYDDIKCVDSNCNGIIASKDGKNKEFVLLDSNGKIISKFKNNKTTYNISVISKNYFISVDQNDDNKTTYILYNKNGKYS